MGPGLYGRLGSHKSHHGQSSGDRKSIPECSGLFTRERARSTMHCLAAFCLHLAMLNSGSLVVLRSARKSLRIPSGDTSSQRAAVLTISVHVHTLFHRYDHTAEFFEKFVSGFGRDQHENFTFYPLRYRLGLLYDTEAFVRDADQIGSGIRFYPPALNQPLPYQTLDQPGHGRPVDARLIHQRCLAHPLGTSQRCQNDKLAGRNNLHGLAEERLCALSCTVQQVDQRVSWSCHCLSTVRRVQVVPHDTSLGQSVNRS